MTSILCKNGIISYVLTLKSIFGSFNLLIYLFTYFFKCSVLFTNKLELFLENVWLGSGIAFITNEATQLRQVQ